MNFFKHIYILLFGIFFSTTSVFADTKINDDVSYVTEFATLNNNVASVSLVWALNSQTKEQNRILQAFLAAKLNGPIGNKSVGEVIDFRIINDINFSIDLNLESLNTTFKLSGQFVSIKYFLFPIAFT